MKRIVREGMFLVPAIGIILLSIFLLQDSFGPMKACASGICTDQHTLFDGSDPVAPSGSSAFGVRAGITTFNPALCGNGQNTASLSAAWSMIEGQNDYEWAQAGYWKQGTWSSGKIFLQFI